MGKKRLSLKEIRVDSFVTINRPGRVVGGEVTMFEACETYDPCTGRPCATGRPDCEFSICICGSGV